MKVLAKNRRAHYDYQIEDHLVAGLVLSGAEVKSIKAGHVSLKGSFVTVKDGELWLNNAQVTPYNMAGNQSRLDPTRPRKLLVHKKQLLELASQRHKGKQLVATAMLEDRNLVKLEVGIGRSKRLYDKRETIKRRTQEIEAKRQIQSKR